MVGAFLFFPVSVGDYYLFRLRLHFWSDAGYFPGDSLRFRLAYRSSRLKTSNALGVQIALSDLRGERLLAALAAY